MVFVFVCVILLHLPHHLYLAAGGAGRIPAARPSESTKMETSTHSRCFGLWCPLILVDTRKFFDVFRAILQLCKWLLALPAKFFCDILNLAQGSFLWQIFSELINVLVQQSFADPCFTAFEQYILQPKWAGKLAWIGLKRSYVLKDPRRTVCQTKSCHDRFPKLDLLFHI